MTYVSRMSPAIKRILKETKFRVRNITKQKFECPVCNYYGPLVDINPPTGLRKHAVCPRCKSIERHRLQKLVIDKIFRNRDTSELRMLHFAPEPFFQSLFKEMFKVYVTTDLYMENVDFKADITNLPFERAEYDFVFASHVLEHIQDDSKALSEIRRVLKPTGLAVLPVPIVGVVTTEYPEPNPYEAYHVRAPGLDYYDRYSNYFNHVEKYYSSDFSEKYQPFIYEDRSMWPTEKCPLRQPMVGERHLDVVPVCYAEQK